PVQTLEPELQMITQDSASESELIHKSDYITKEEANKKQKTRSIQMHINSKKLDLSVEPYEASDLDGCKTLFYNLELNDPKAVHLLILKELESKGGSELKNLINKKFECLEKIKRHKRSEKDLEFRKQEELKTAVKKKTIAIHHAKVFKSHPDNRRNIEKC
ncbi:1330_t:CDS:2, partial [Cetraspora pellucida]